MNTQTIFGFAFLIAWLGLQVNFAQAFISTTLLTIWKAEADSNVKRIEITTPRIQRVASVGWLILGFGFIAWGQFG